MRFLLGNRKREMREKSIHFVPWRRRGRGEGEQGEAKERIAI